MKKILSILLFAGALCSLLTLASSSVQSSATPAGPAAQFQLADDPLPPLPPPPGSGNTGDKYA